jgi:hypothetical protein
MNKRFLPFALLGLVVIITAFGNKTIPTESNLQNEWLIGTWENKTPRGTIFETWKKTSDKQYDAKSYVIREKDTMVFESITLKVSGDEIHYIPAVKNQNEGLPVVFKATTYTETEMIFENPEHDFPQVISYNRITSDSLVAKISGTKNGQERSQSFPMKKIK